MHISASVRLHDTMFHVVLFCISFFPLSYILFLPWSPRCFLYASMPMSGHRCKRTELASLGKFANRRIVRGLDEEGTGKGIVA